MLCTQQPHREKLLGIVDGRKGTAHVAANVSKPLNLAVQTGEAPQNTITLVTVNNQPFGKPPSDGLRPPTPPSRLSLRSCR